METIIDSVVILPKLDNHPRKSTYTVRRNDTRGPTFYSLKDAVAATNDWQRDETPYSPCVELVLTYDDTVKLVKSVKTRKVTLYIQVSHFAPGITKEDEVNKTGWRASGTVKLTRGELLRFLKDAYNNSALAGRVMVKGSLYDNCLFIGAST